jgi:hypothetical protein
MIRLTTMDRTILVEHLAEVDRHVALGEKHIRRQREIVAEVRQRGDDVTRSEILLGLFEEMQQTHLEDRRRIRDELARN